MDKVNIYEVGPRDGLQNEKSIIPTPQKVALVDLLSKVGFNHIEVASFVSSKWVPQMADSTAVLQSIARTDGVNYVALTPNLKGFLKAVDANADEVAIFGSASETFSQKNINCSIDESLARFQPIAEAATQAKIPVRGYVSCVASCPYEGLIAPNAVRNVAEKLLALGCYEISLGDTIGHGIPEQISTMLDCVLEAVPADRLAGHYHDTNNRAIDNIRASLGKGIRTFDSAVGGLGGCPYAPGAKGNVSTMALAEALQEDGWDTGLNLTLLRDAEIYLEQEIGSLSGR